MAHSTIKNGSETKMFRNEVIQCAKCMHDTGSLIILKKQNILKNI